MTPSTAPFRILAVLAVAFGASGTASSQAIDTNRPGFSFSPNVVATGEWQLETGIAYERLNSDTDLASLPNAELRYGVMDAVEVFVSSVNWSRISSSGSDTSGFRDVAVGAKARIGDGLSPTQMALLFQLSVPTGASRFSSDRWDPSLAFIWAHGGRINLAGTVKLTDFRGGYQLDNGLKLPFSISDSQSAFVEWEANLPEGSGPLHWLNGGYQWLLDANTQIDFNAGLGLNDRAGDYRLGAGFSIRF